MTGILPKNQSIMNQTKEQPKTFTVIVAGMTVTRPLKKTPAEKELLKDLKKKVENPIFTRRAKLSII